MKKSILFFIFVIIVVENLVLPVVCFAGPYGEGNYDANVPYGAQTSLSIATNGNVSIPITPTPSGVLATGTSTVTVTSTDVVGYTLYVRALGSTNMTNGAAMLPTSANGSPAALAVDTWGYNTDGSGNYVGMALTDTLIKSFAGPIETGDTTTFTYGVKLDLAQAAGQYSGSILYTAAPQTN